LHDAFHTIDDNNSGMISKDELTGWLRQNGYPELETAQKSFWMIVDADHSNLVSLSEFLAMNEFSGNFFMEQIQGLVEWLIQTYGDFGWAFDEVRAAGSSGTAHGEINMSVFRRGLMRLKCPLIDVAAWTRGSGIDDPARSIFNFFDQDHSGAISRDEWTKMFICFNENVGRDGLTTFKARLEADFGSLEQVYKYLVRFRFNKKQKRRASCRRGAVSTGKALQKSGAVMRSRYATDCFLRGCEICGTLTGGCLGKRDENHGF
jgi:Ca2+-binding EF-hand superfamily protein